MSIFGVFKKADRPRTLADEKREASLKVFESSVQAILKRMLADINDEVERGGFSLSKDPANGAVGFNTASDEVFNRLRNLGFSVKVRKTQRGSYHVVPANVTISW